MLFMLAACGRPPAKENVLIVVLDDVGVDRLAIYGAAEGPATPNLDALAARGVRFTRAWSRPVCTPTRASIQTGRYGRRTGATMGWPTTEPWEVSPDHVSIADLAKQAGYATSAVGKWHIGTESAPSGLDQPAQLGWDWFSGSFGNLFEGLQPQSYYDWTYTVNGEQERAQVYATTRTVDDALARIAAMPEPWLLLVAFNAAHTPFERPPERLVPTPTGGPHPVYSDMIAAADTETGRLFAQMGDDLLARTNVFLVSDNGTDTDVADVPPRAKGSLFEGGVRVPFIVAGPAATAAGTASDALVDVVDLWPTVAAIAGATPPAGYAVDGLDLSRLLRDPTAPFGRLYAYNESSGPPGPGPYVDKDRQTLSDGEYKLIVDHLSGLEMFFRLADGDEGPDLLRCGLDAAAEGALDRLRAELVQKTAELAYDGGDYAPAREGWLVFDVQGDTGLPDCGR
jgi:arylsulfatase A-like enzyme